MDQRRLTRKKTEEQTKKEINRQVRVLVISLTVHQKKADYQFEI